MQGRPDRREETNVISQPNGVNNSYGSVNQNGQIGGIHHQDNRSQPRSRHSDAAHSDAPTVARSLQQGRRKERSADERKKNALRALKDLQKVRSLADNKRLSAKKKVMISALTYRPEEVIKDSERVRRENEDLRAEVEDLRRQMKTQQSKSPRYKTS
eukprot:GEMP01080544.1.p1 GENE.GEMP01080544.1~~GEMP01080544.1.p1  ORF type:complete len:157 (+),score=47.49 GEMP01080544.1:576-1046(+)